MDKVMEYAISVLNTQEKHLREHHTAEQEAFVVGMREMLDIFLSEAHTNGKYTALNGKGEVYVMQMRR